MAPVSKVNRVYRTSSHPSFKNTSKQTTQKCTKVNRPYQIARASILRKAVSLRSQAGSLDTSKFKYNQSPVESTNGSRVLFTLPNSDNFISGLIELFINGNQKIKDVEWQETGTTQITLIGSWAASPPASNEVIKMNYIKV